MDSVGPAARVVTEALRDRQRSVAESGDVEVSLCKQRASIRSRNVAEGSGRQRSPALKLIGCPFIARIHGVSGEV